MKSGALPQIAGSCRMTAEMGFLQLEDALVVVVNGLDFLRGEFPIARLGVLNRHRRGGCAHQRAGNAWL